MKITNIDGHIHIQLDPDAEQPDVWHPIPGLRARVKYVPNGDGMKLYYIDEEGESDELPPGYKTNSLSAPSTD